MPDSQNHQSAAPVPGSGSVGGSGSAPVHRRRPRYKGTHPRSFREKYKEHAPGLYPEDVARIRAKGKTPAGSHVPILVDEVLGCLKPVAGGIVADVTLGYGGHAARLMDAINPGGTLVGLDADPIELPKTERRLLALPSASGVTLSLHRSNYAGLSRVLAAIGIEAVDMLLADLGLSSMQIDDPDRGFSWKSRGPLDMRMNPSHGRPASEWVADASAATLAEWFREHADEPQAAWIAESIVKERGKRAITTTEALAAVVEGCLSVPHPGFAASPPEARELSIRRVFQAIRIAVNDEFGALDNLLRQLPGCLRPAGRVAILTFHSGEDRRVKRSFEKGFEDGLYSQISAEVIRPQPQEIRMNPRAAPAKLRWAIRSV